MQAQNTPIDPNHKLRITEVDTSKQENVLEISWKIDLLIQHESRHHICNNKLIHT